MSTPANVPDRPRGVVAPARARKMFRMERYLPAPALAPRLKRFLDHFWTWDAAAQYEVLECEDDAGMAVLAQELGYFDQAHFSSDFRKLVGESPARYRKHARGRARSAAS